MLKTIWVNYRYHPYFSLGYGLVEDALHYHFKKLYCLNRYLLDRIVEGFGINTKIVTASIDVPTDLMNNARNIYQCKQLGGTVYFSGAGGGRSYNDEQAYNNNGIKLVYSDYRPVKYPQYHNKTFIENLSVLDYICNVGYKIPEGWA